MTTLGTQLRQGDILAVAVDSRPQDSEPVLIQPGGAFALVPGDAGAEGRHLVTAGPALRAFARPDNPALIEWIQIDEQSVRLTHPQHGALVLAPGVWRIIRQRAFDPETGQRPQRD